MSALRNSAPAWLLTAWEWFDSHPEVILSAWSRAEFGGWNLSYEFLTSPYAQSTVKERFDDDKDFAISVSTAAEPDLQAELETNTDGFDFDDDSALSTETICSLQANPEPRELSSLSAMSENGSFFYVGDEELTGNDAEGEQDPEFVSEQTSAGSVSSPLVYRHASAMRSSSSLADLIESDESQESDSEVEILPSQRPVTSNQGDIVVPADLIGATFTIDD